MADYETPHVPPATPPTVDPKADAKDARTKAQRDGDSETDGTPEADGTHSSTPTEAMLKRDKLDGAGEEALDETTPD